MAAWAWVQRRSAATAAPWGWIPIGSFEQHGPHLPLATDTLIAIALAEALADRFGGVLAPPVTVGCSQEHRRFPGTLSVPAALLAAWVQALVEGVAACGARWVALVNGHGGNYVLEHVAAEGTAQSQEALHLVVLPQARHWEAALDRAGVPWKLDRDLHAGAVETALVMALYPELGVVPPDPAQDVDPPAGPWVVAWGLDRYTPNGVLGRPSEATAEAGARIWQALVDAVSDDWRRWTQG
ncbi:MAG: creatininase family protein [Firmicutes bacterium]|nr:creatininase family protein [Alicyclobacillaceae bacterium]MCL6497523.1 creatininase family protein [Bacillota bacterium]